MNVVMTYQIHHEDGEVEHPVPDDSWVHTVVQISGMLADRGDDTHVFVIQLPRDVLLHPFLPALQHELSEALTDMQKYAKGEPIEYATTKDNRNSNGTRLE